MRVDRLLSAAPIGAGELIATDNPKDAVLREGDKSVLDFFTFTKGPQDPRCGAGPQAPALVRADVSGRGARARLVLPGVPSP